MPPTRPSVEYAYDEGNKMMGRAGKQLGTLARGGPQDIRFRSFFGAGAVVVVDAYCRLIDNGLFPVEVGLRFVHFLWALAFMCLYPKNQASLCTLCGGVDPKTVRKKIWPFIYALHDLNHYVVRVSYFFSLCTVKITCLSKIRSLLLDLIRKQVR